MADDLHARLVAALRARLEVARAATGANLREQLAAIEHERWAHWQRWMHSQCPSSPVTGDRVIPAHLVERWERQIATPYADLSEREKDSDREQVDRYLPLVIAANDPATEIRRVEALLRVVERHAPEYDMAVRAITPHCAAHLAPAWGDRQPWPCDDIRDLAAGEGIEVGE